MYRDGSMDDSEFQYMIMKFQSKYTSQKKSPMTLQPSFRDEGRREKHQTKGVTTI